MAEEDAEIALLHQLQAGQESAWLGEDENGAMESEQPSVTEDEDNENIKKETSADQVQRALSTSGSGALDDGAPSSITPIPADSLAGEEQSRSSSRASARRPRVVGGFIADDSDEETDESTPTGLQVAATTNTTNRPLSPSPLAQLQIVTNNDTISSFPDTALPVISSAVGTTPVPSTPAPIVPKARLPHDTMGKLEDRIKDDPKGDIEAWLSLITEHRNRHRLPEARELYERFFKVFPEAVSVCSLYYGLFVAYLNRPKYGLRMQKWRSRTITLAPLRTSLGERYCISLTSDSGPSISITFVE
jgi:cleavage stimulation factor subunit 3